MRAHSVTMMRSAVRMFSSAAKFTPRPKWEPPSDLKYSIREIDPAIIRPSQWSPPMGGYEHLPFRVFRTVKGKALPVYTDYRNGRTRCMTIVRRYRGDAEELAREMSKVCDGRVVTIRPGRVEVKGNYRGRIDEWLKRLGF